MNVNSIINQYGTPVYVYAKDNIFQNYQAIVNAFPYENKQIHYAVMCNSNKEVLRVIHSLNGSLQINSLFELELAIELGFTKDRISFTSTGMAIDSLKKIIKEGIQVNLDSLEEVEKFCSLGSGRTFGIRVNIKDNIELEEGHTNSYKNSDVGILEEDFANVIRIAKKNGCKITGVHGYLASNLLEVDPFIRFANYLAYCAMQFKDLKYINFGSGFGVPSEPVDKLFDFKKIGSYYSKISQDLSDFFCRNIQLKIEPGRSIVANAGILFAKVTNVKQLKEKKQAAIDVGFGGFARPKLYDAYHLVKVVGKKDNVELYDVRADTVLQSDFIARDRLLSRVNENDIVAIMNAGGYGIVMASGFPGQKKPAEVLVNSFSDEI